MSRLYSEEDTGLDEEDVVRSLVKLKVSKHHTSSTRLDRSSHSLASSALHSAKEDTCFHCTQGGSTESSVLIARDDESVWGQSVLDALLDKVGDSHRIGLGTAKFNGKKKNPKNASTSMLRAGPSVKRAADDVLLVQTRWNIIRSS